PLRKTPMFEWIESFEPHPTRTAAKVFRAGADGLSSANRKRKPARGQNSDRGRLGGLFRMVAGAGFSLPPAEPAPLVNASAAAPMGCAPVPFERAQAGRRARKGNGRRARAGRASSRGRYRE